MGTIVTINQDSDTPARREITPGAVLTYVYDRSRDSKKGNGTGQDFIAYGYDEHKVVFAVCDGVSQSFYGDISARFLGESLVYWLLDMSRKQFKALRQETLHHNTPFVQTELASKLVKSKVLGTSLPPMVRDALERKRDNGSETMFVAGRVDFSSKVLTVFWMGDMRLWLWGHDDQPVELPGAVWDTRERWSSRVGPKNGSVRMATVALDSIARIVVHTDGIGSRVDDLDTISIDKLNTIARELGNLPTSDDLSILDIALASVGAEALPAPELYFPHPNEPVIQWGAVDGAEWYRVGFGADEQYWTIDVDNTSFFLDRAEREDRTALDRYEYAVQAMSSDRLPGQWSKPLQFQRLKTEAVAEPAAEAAEPVRKESLPIVTNRRPFRFDPLMAMALLLALLMTAGWYLLFTRGQ